MLNDHDVMLKSDLSLKALKASRWPLPPINKSRLTFSKNDAVVLFRDEGGATVVVVQADVIGVDLEGGAALHGQHDSRVVGGAVGLEGHLKILTFFLPL